MGINTKVICTKSKIVDIADAIRLRNNSEDTYSLDNISSAIPNLNNKYIVNFSGATPNTTITANGNGNTFSTTSDSGGSGTLIIYGNGTYIITDTSSSIVRTISFNNQGSIAF